MECEMTNKEVCTTIKEEVRQKMKNTNYIQFNLKKFQVCSPDTVSNCEEIDNVNCNLVPDVVCRNITETR